MCKKHRTPHKIAIKHYIITYYTSAVLSKHLTNTAQHRTLSPSIVFAQKLGLSPSQYYLLSAVLCGVSEVLSQHRTGVNSLYYSSFTHT